MKKAKFLKFLSLSMCIVLSVIVISGCGQKESGDKKPLETKNNVSNDENQKNDAKAEDTSVDEETLEHVTLTWYVQGTPQNDTQEVMEEVNKLLKEKMNASLDLVFIDWGDYDTKMQMTIASQDPFDICFTANWSNDINRNISNGSFLALNDLLDVYGQDIKSFLPESGWGAVSKGGNIYAVPAEKPSIVPGGIGIKEELLDKYNFDINSIKKLHDLEPLLALIKENEKDLIPYFAMDSEAFQFLGQDDPYRYVTVTEGIYYDTVEMKCVNKFETPPYLTYVELMNQWQKKGYINRGQANITDNLAEKKSGKYGVLSLNAVFDKGETATVDYGYPVKTIITGKPVLVTSAMQNLCNAISVNSKNPERAMMLLNTMFAQDELSRKIFNTIAFGIEGKHYTFDSEGYLEFVPDSGYSARIAWEKGPVINKYMTKVENEEWVEAFYKNSENLKPSILLGYIPDLEPIKSEFAQVDAIRQEFAGTGSLVNSGMIDLDTFSKILDRMNKAGLDKILAELDNQINNWLQENAN